MKIINYIFSKLYLLLFILAFAGLVFVLIQISGCKTKKITETTHSTTHLKTDTVYLERTELLKDTAFIIQRDSSTIKALIKCDEKGRAYIAEITELKTGTRIKTILRQNYDTIFIRSTIDSAAIYFTYKSTHTREFKETTTKETTLDKEKTRKTVFKIPLWAWIIIIVIAIYIIIKYLWPLIRKVLIGL